MTGALNPSSVAVLFADRDGVYSGFPGCDIWDRSRDARLYTGDSVVVAHPPCESWGKLYAMKPGRRLGDDGGRFASALASVERCGGVLEHPEGSFAWLKFGLCPPVQGEGWVKDRHRPGWSCQVYQGCYGHKAAKSTWLYYVGPVEPFPLDFGPSPGGRNLSRLSSRSRRATPFYFADVLVRLAHLACRRELADLACRRELVELADLACRGELVELAELADRCKPAELVELADLADRCKPAELVELSYRYDFLIAS